VITFFIFFEILAKFPKLFPYIVSMEQNKNIQATKRVYCPHCAKSNFGFVVIKNKKVIYSICNFCGKYSDLP